MKKTSITQASGPAPPNDLNYQPSGEPGPWRVMAFADLVGELGLSPKPDWPQAMAWVHAQLMAAPRAWQLARRLYGIVPVLVPAGTQHDDLRLWKRGELQKALGLSPTNFRAEIEAISGLLRRRELPDPEMPDVVPPEVGQSSELFHQDQPELPSSERALLDAGFPPSIHDYVGATPEDKRMERLRLAERVSEWEPMLRDPMARILARQALLNELLLRRTELALLAVDPNSGRFRELEAQKSHLEEEYRNQLLELDKIFPWRGLAGGKVSFRGSIAEVVLAVRDVHANKDYRLIDGIQNACEVEILWRQSEQISTPRWRLGQTMYLLSAIDGLFDPRWRSQFSEIMLKKMDRVGQRLIDEARAAIEEPLPDLTRDDEIGEYADLPVPAPIPKGGGS